MKFIIDNKLARLVNNQLVNSKETNIGSWNYLINWTNMRSLINYKEFQGFVSSLNGNDGENMALIVNLHAILGSFLDHTLLNTIVNRTMRAISLLDIDVPENIRKLEWTEIHEMVPCMWLIIYIQHLIKSESTLEI